MPYCGECGAEHWAEASYCGACGTEISTGENGSAPTQTDNSNKGSVIWTLPLLERGKTGRNVAVGFMYLLFLPYVLLIWIPYTIGTNKNGWGDKVANSPLGKVPGISNGGWSAGIAIFLLLVLAGGGGIGCSDFL